MKSLLLYSVLFFVVVGYVLDTTSYEDAFNKCITKHSFSTCQRILR